MCGRFVSGGDTAEVVALFSVDQVRDNVPGPSWNIAPTQGIRIVVDQIDAETGSMQRILTTARWGLIPSWAKAIPQKPLINARSETVTSKPSFRSAVAKYRVLVPAQGWYEWTGDRGSKQPWFLQVADQPLVGLAGIASWWRQPATSGTPQAATGSASTDPSSATGGGEPSADSLAAGTQQASAAGAPADAASTGSASTGSANTDPSGTGVASTLGDWVLSAAVLTRPATDVAGQIHDRAPIPVPADMVADWLLPEKLTGDVVNDMLASIPEPTVQATRAHQDVGVVRHNHPGLLTP